MHRSVRPHRAPRSLEILIFVSQDAKFALLRLPDPRLYSLCWSAEIFNDLSQVLFRPCTILSDNFTLCFLGKSCALIGNFAGNKAFSLSFDECHDSKYHKTFTKVTTILDTKHMHDANRKNCRTLILLYRYD